MSNRSRSPSPTYNDLNEHADYETNFKNPQDPQDPGEPGEIIDSRCSSNIEETPKAFASPDTRYSPSRIDESSNQDVVNQILNTPYSPEHADNPKYLQVYSPTRPDSHHSIGRIERNPNYKRRDNGDTSFRYNNCRRCGYEGHSTRDCITIQCSKCRGYGHRQRDCPSIVCNTCERLGHTSEECKNSRISNQNRNTSHTPPHSNQNRDNRRNESGSRSYTKRDRDDYDRRNESRNARVRDSGYSRSRSESDHHRVRPYSNERRDRRRRY